MKQNFIQELKGNRPPRIPLWLMRQAGRYLPEYRAVREKAGDFLSLCYNPALASEVTLQPLRRFDLDAAIIFSDILVVPHALGQAVRFEAGEGPVLDPIQGIGDLPAFDPDDFINRLGPVFEALALSKAALPAEKSLIGFAGAPWTLACYMVQGGGSRDFEKVRRMAVTRPDRFQAIIDCLTDAVSLYLVEKIRNGADAVQIFDSWAGILSAAEFEKWVIAPTRKITETIRLSFPGTPVIGFPRLAGMSYPAYIEQTGIDAIGLDQTVPLSQAVILQKKYDIAVQGNLDPLLLLKGGKDMVNQVTAICDALSGGRFIFNLGHGVIKETDPENVALLVETVRNFGKRS